MTKHIIIVVALALGAIGATGLVAVAQDAAAVDAGVDAGVIAPAAALNLPDPVEQPGATIDVVRTTYRDSGLWAGLIVALTIVLRATSRRISTVGALSFLRRWRWPAVIAGAAGVAGALAEQAAGDGTWSAVLFAAVAAVAVFVDGFGVDSETAA